MEETCKSGSGVCIFDPTFTQKKIKKMCNQKKVSDHVNMVVSFSTETKNAGDIHGGGGLIPSPSPYVNGDGTYELEYLTCDCHFKVVVKDGTVYEYDPA